ncbi:MAG: decarboxylating 6-phosphogluconate dehydrogenase [Candidatus Moraniibacteriota bacterium]
MKNKFKLGYIGLGKMGFNMIERLIEKGNEVVVNDIRPDSIERATRMGAIPAYCLEELVENLSSPRLVWLMVPNSALDGVLDKLIPILSEGDTVIDGGNTRYIETQSRVSLFEDKRINFLDIGVSGGPNGARKGACLMIGGKKNIYEKYENLFIDIAAPEAYGYFGDHGAGHFVKMVHNGIEYGMMQAIAEGFGVLKESEFNLDLKKVAEVYNNKSVIESRLVNWLSSGYQKYGTELEGISGSVSHTGEGLWTIEAAKKIGVPTPVIEESLKFREDSIAKPSYTGKVLAVLRNMFGGHSISN